MTRKKKAELRSKINSLEFMAETYKIKAKIREDTAITYGKEMDRAYSDGEKVSEYDSIKWKYSMQAAADYDMMSRQIEIIVEILKDLV